VHHEYLAVYIFACTDADDGDFNGFCDYFCQRCGDLFQYDGETACFLQQLRVVDELIGFAFFRGAYGVGAEFVNRLRREPRWPITGTPAEIMRFTDSMISSPPSILMPWAPVSFIIRMVEMSASFELPW
jgi:hypothetical protein